MKPIDEALMLTSCDEIRRKIDDRHRAVYQMGGQLYPSIIAGEIGRLYQRLKQLSREE